MEDLIKEEDKKLVEKELTKEVKAEVAYKEGKILVEIEADFKVADVKLMIALDALDVALAGLDVVKEKVPGKLDDALIDAAKEALKALK